MKNDAIVKGKHHVRHVGHHNGAKAHWARLNRRKEDGALVVAPERHHFHDVIAEAAERREKFRKQKKVGD